MNKLKGNETKDHEEQGNETLLLSSEGLASFGGRLSSSGASVMIWSEDVGTGFSGVTFVEVFNELVGVSEIGRGGPLEFFVGAFVTEPLYVVK